MMRFTEGEVGRIRIALSAGCTVRTLCVAFPVHTRDEIVEAIDAINRCPWDVDARDRVNHVLEMQGAGLALVNGRPAL